MTTLTPDQAKVAAQLSESIWPRVAPYLTGYPADVQGAALADIVAAFLAGHMVPGDRAATQELRESILAVHIDFVRKLIPANCRRTGTEISHDEH